MDTSAPEEEQEPLVLEQQSSLLPLTRPTEDTDADARPGVSADDSALAQVAAVPVSAGLGNLTSSGLLAAFEAAGAFEEKKEEPSEQKETSEKKETTEKKTSGKKDKTEKKQKGEKGEQKKKGEKKDKSDKKEKADKKTKKEKREKTEAQKEKSQLKREKRQQQRKARTEALKNPEQDKENAAADDADSKDGGDQLNRKARRRLALIDRQRDVLRGELKLGAGETSDELEAQLQTWIKATEGQAALRAAKKQKRLEKEGKGDVYSRKGKAVKLKERRKVLAKIEKGKKKQAKRDAKREANAEAEANGYEEQGEEPAAES